MKSKTGADQSLDYNFRNEKSLRPSGSVMLRKNRQTVHIFRDSRAKKCMCGSTSRSHYARNHVSKRVKISKVVCADEPSDVGLLGRSISENGLRRLDKILGKEVSS